MAGPLAASLLSLLWTSRVLASDDGFCLAEGGVACGQGLGTGPLDHWPVVEDAVKCKLDHCSRETAACVLDPACVEQLASPVSCGADFACYLRGQKAAAGCPVYVAMLTCWGRHRCQETRPQHGGPCAATGLEEGLASIASLEAVRDSGLDFAKCQHWRMDSTRNLVTFTVPKEDGGSTVASLHQHISLPHPGVIRASYHGELPEELQLEDYHIIDSDPDHLLIIFCHGLPDLQHNGALVLSRHRTGAALARATLDSFQGQIKAHGMDPQNMCTFDNTECTN